MEYHKLFGTCITLSLYLFSFFEQSRHNDAIQCMSYNPVTHQLASCAVTDFGNLFFYLFMKPYGCLFKLVINL